MLSAFIKLLATIYALFIFVGGELAASDSSVLGYPFPIVAITAAVYVALPLGIIALAFRWYPAWILKYWKPIYYLCVADLVLGTLMDAFVPSDYNLTTDGFSWVINTSMVVLLLLPAFYLNYKLAFYRHG